MKNRYNFTVTLKVSVDAFDEADAVDMISDTYGAGALYEEIDVKSCEVKIERPKSNQS
jgi:hypothetical protein